MNDKEEARLERRNESAADDIEARELLAGMTDAVASYDILLVTMMKKKVIAANVIDRSKIDNIGDIEQLIDILIDAVKRK